MYVPVEVILTLSAGVCVPCVLVQFNVADMERVNFPSRSSGVEYPTCWEI